MGLGTTIPVVTADIYKNHELSLVILDENFIAIKEIDEFESLIWVDRYNSYGDFELYTVMKQELLDYLQIGYYVWMAKSVHVMIIERIEIKSDIANGARLIVTGRSLESILDRRIIWDQTEVRGSLQGQILTLLEQAIVAPTDGRRCIPNFRYVETRDDRLEVLIDTQFTGTNLYDAIHELCDAYEVGFMIYLNKANEFVFSLYKGTDYSYAQEINPYVEFSPSYDNLINSDYYNDITPLKTVTLVAGEGEGDERKKIEVDLNPELTGLDRRELFTDARDISSFLEGGETMEEDVYYTKLINRGAERLAERGIELMFQGETETTRMYRYGEDFYMGDIVQVANEWGLTDRVRIIELIFSEDSEGYSVYPTFTSTEEEVEDDRDDEMAPPMS